MSDFAFYPWTDEPRPAPADEPPPVAIVAVVNWCEHGELRAQCAECGGDALED